MKSTFNNDLWKNKQFARLFFGTTISNLTFYIFTFLLPILIFEYTNSSFAMSIMRAIEVLPNIIFAVLIGVLVDRYNKKKILLNALVLQIISISIIILLLHINEFNLWILYLLGLVLFTSQYTFGNAYHTIIPLIIHKEQLTDSNAILSFMNTLILLIGPSFAALMISFFSVKISLMITILGLLLLYTIIFFSKIPGIQSKSKNASNSISSDIKEGWHHLIKNNILWNMTLIILSLNISIALSGSVLIYYALNDLFVTKSQLGFILTSTGIGALIGSLIAKKITRYLNRGKIYIVFLFNTFLGVLILFFFSEWYGLISGLLLLGISQMVINIHYLTIRQETTPSHLLGRVAGTSSMIMKSAAPLAFLSGGLIAEYFPVKYIFLISAILIFVSIIFSFKLKLWKFK
ncbi:MFS transporter [Solibacillus sp. NPDC093137]|uniref:MFS transporter n=1 Tax=Solibacillus sp. NPDC093137 TaxID=3390678 RepID=UPI003D037076